ncbi:hypothetical protein HYPDE_25463 [Hyphomicrobium denitrificans 1NES1]|uniref:Uncharacterized protein n=1 Tax=Hyphomicrobium denitrificans 1NES1 TaxID=670307 RepID=N0B3I9_9HYPH|nr:hypothetical protein [Hyphomicrobium denitrificans]AGK56777.1 hypothetical protein HYPDE_25463 [Hyphomicrobium denitrificans 1NES1]
MNEAQVGLVTLTPVLLVFIIFMYRQGAMTKSGAVVAALLSIVIATAMFVGQI